MAARDDYPRTTCACDKCVAACKHMPGFLAVDDLEAMLPEDLDADMGEPDEWLRENFVASQGAKVLMGGRIQTIPTITPRLTEQGCVFLQDGKCTVHAAAPFGCGWFDVCDDEGKGVDAKIRQAFNEIIEAFLADASYARAWQRLHDTGNHATDIRERKQNLATAIKEIESR